MSSLLKLNCLTATMMDRHIWQGWLSLKRTWRSCSSKLRCWVFSLLLDFNIHRLIYSDKLDLIHRLLSSIYSTTGLCHPLDIRTAVWYHISYRGYESSGRIETCDLRIVYDHHTVLWEQGWTFCSTRGGLFSSHMLCGLCRVIFPELLGHVSQSFRHSLFWKLAI